MQHKKILSVLLIILILSFNFITAFAADTDVELNNAYNYIFKLNPREDLFQNFKGIMPGDHKTQLIALQNTESDKNITIYMRAETFEEYKEFLDWMTLKVYKSETPNGEKILLSQNHASEPGKLVTDIKLATMAPGEKVYITVILDVDIKMGNSQALTNGIIRWIFSCEEEEIIDNPTKPTTEPTTKHTDPSEPTKPTGPTVPSTDTPSDKPTTGTTKYNDDNPQSPFTGSQDTLLWISMTVIIISALAGFAAFISKKNKNYILKDI